ncbi:hypothetical protein [Tengunoibacter tsumagoiensis]|nr:hypothetical protein [Tengunoibacter tsumagoiensis]
MRQRQFNLRRIRFDGLGALLIPMGLGIFAVYCQLHFHDFLAFSHAQSVWGRSLRLPPLGFLSSLKIILSDPPLTFASIHNVVDLSAGCMILALVILSFVGPWRFHQSTMAYALYGAAAFLFVILFPSNNGAPLQSQMRLVMEVFPAFIVLSSLLSSHKSFIAYTLIANSLTIFFLLQFLTGFWMV